MATSLKIESCSSLRREPGSDLKGTVIVYFSPLTVDSADPTAFCKEHLCPRLTEAPGRQQEIFTCTGPQPFNGNQFLATIPFDRSILAHVDALFDEKLKPFTAPCGANQRMFFDARIATGG